MRTLATRLKSPLIRLLFTLLLAVGIASTSEGSVFVSVAIAPPPIPVYVQPVCPGPNYIWIPGYWAWDPANGYYWVPGYWDLAPYVGALWTPGWWGFAGGVYAWHPGYWGRHVGFYGGINYGFGYFGVGYVGGYWSGSAFRYNSAVTNVNVAVVHNNIYNRAVTETTASRVSFNGGPGGISRQANAQERLAQRDSHRSLTSSQVQHEHLARADRGQWASVNQGAPSVMATSRAAAVAGRSGEQRAGVPGAAANAPAHRQAQSARVDTRTQASAPQVHREARVEQRVAQPSAPPVHREARVEQRAAPPGAAAPIARPEARAHVAARPDAHAQGVPRTESHAAAQRPEMHAQGAPRPEVRAPVAPRPEMHAMNAPHAPAHAGPPPGEPRGAHPGGQRDEEHGPR